jgi:hypothetical protein
VRVPGIEFGVVVEGVSADDALRCTVDAACRDKYGSPGDESVGRMISEEAAATTLRLSPDCPRVEKVEAAARKDRDALPLERLPDGCQVIDDEAEVPGLVAPRSSKSRRRPWKSSAHRCHRPRGQRG